MKLVHLMLDPLSLSSYLPLPVDYSIPLFLPSVVIPSLPPLLPVPLLRSQHFLFNWIRYEVYNIT